MKKRSLPLLFFVTSIVVLIISLLAVLGGTVFGLYEIGSAFIKIVFGVHIVILVIGAGCFVSWAKSLNQ